MHLYKESEEPVSVLNPPQTDKCPHKRARTDSAPLPPPPPTMRNKFKEVKSDIMPPALKMWCKAAEKIGETFNPNAHPAPLGYFLPDPQMITTVGQTTQKFETQTAFLELWLKLQHRMILGIEQLLFKDEKSKKQKAKVEEILTEMLNTAGMQCSVDVSHLGSAMVRWQNSLINISHASLLMMDCQFYCGALTREEPEPEILSAM
ncbi:hypothetical protein Moror_716 [Moniliophthora roreri MCA 2997]|uniref:Uncharacterized protein n=1 Tax=Moniliophthora roreri (strain MCA 2997) TaxID=1381753 RepID=V2XQY5_MONRO|nr:hypothetical protein Moror_716 [Moniliophthora roreri MCA 2997]